ncbi:alpha-L-fucosidase [Brachybacterium sp. YJGR34]|uniref:alpha-L-fucosidase n=1 Tax=Brachybacterium sp. YJGR34 TaxID=2059911 RepID=UPI001E62F5D3|nr:alpha-L-fucosidase [Brachybacterium sp. YJGR34]
MTSARSLWTADRQLPSSTEPVRFGPLVGRRDDEAMRAFRSYGLGQFIHWGLYSMLGDEWEGRSARGHAPASEWIRQWNPETAPEGWPEVYDALADQFDPQGFDARAWARQAKEMGARYVIFTTKHHDGFALWPSEHSGTTIARSPYPGDIVGEVVGAYQAEGIDVFLYFSVLEWNHPDYVRHVPRTEEERERWARFEQYTRAQLLELLDRYPGVKGLWFDGTWDPSWVAAHEFTHRLEQELRAAAPGLIIGSRFRGDEHGSRHVDSTGALLGDYEQGWERKMPPNLEMLDGHDWDCVMPLPPNGWGHIRDTEGLYLKTGDDLIELLMRARSMNGNLVINVGPDGDGALSAHENRVLAEVGAFARENAAAIYDARHVDLPEPRCGLLTGADDTLYLTVLSVPVTGAARLAVPRDAERVPIAARLLAGGAPLAVTWQDIGYDLDPMTYYDIALPSAGNVEGAFVVEIDLAAPDARARDLMDAAM